MIYSSHSFVNISEFQKLIIGKLIYLTVARLNIAYDVQILSQHMHKPHKSHLNNAFGCRGI